MHSLRYIYMCTDTPSFILTIYKIFNILLIDDVDAHDVVIVPVFVAGNGDDEHNDFTTDDAMLLVVYKYQSSLLLWCKLTAI